MLPRTETRRTFLRGGVTTAALWRVPAWADSSDRGLRDLASARGLVFGCASFSKALEQDLAFSRAVRNECGILVPEWEMKWEPIHPTVGGFDFRLADKLVNFARTAHMRVRGHTLVWHEAMPAWLADALRHGTARDAEQLMATHIRRVVHHYRGALTSLDVVNEAIRPEDGRPGGLRDTPWLRALGPTYIDRAFYLAHEADPDTPLVYNETSLEYAAQEPERRAVLHLLERFRKTGVPCAGLGIQAHLFANGPPFYARSLSRFVSDVADLGYRIFITELDVIDDPKEKDVLQRDQAIADEAERFLDIVLDHKKVTTLLTWGLSDRYTWRRTSSNPLARPLPLDENMHRKPLWFAIARAIGSAPLR